MPLMSHPQSASSETLGFRPPQFSDDVAWLPNWLQPHVATMAFDAKEDNQHPHNRAGRSAEELSQSRGSKYRHQDSYGLLFKDRTEGLRLHLSGDDDSPVPGTSCPEKQVLQFTLRFSTDGSSGTSLFPMIETSEDKRVTPIEQSVEDIQGSNNIKQLNTESNHGSMKLFSSSSDRNKAAVPFTQTLFNPQSSRKQSLPKTISIKSEDQEISDAVELSTAASEALVIYELIEGEPSHNALSSRKLLELALKVKQTRSEWLNDVLTFSNSNDTISRSDVLSDLDDSEMEDAYEDVGLSCTKSLNFTSVSQVAETLISRQHLGEDGTAGSKWEGQENVTCSNGADKQLEILHIDLALDSADANKENLVMNHDHLDQIPSIASGDDLMMHQLHQRTSDENIRQEDASGGAELRGTKHFRQNFTVTSFLSESADFPPDLNSCINSHDQSKISQSSIKFEGLCMTKKFGPLLSQDIATDSILSSVDPLCSVIPCSISPRIHDNLPAHFSNDEEHNGGKEMMPELDLETQDMPIMARPNEIISTEKQDDTAAHSFDSYLNQRHTASLDAYNTQSPGKPCLLQNEPSLVEARQAEVAKSGGEQNTLSVNSLTNGHCQAAKSGAELQISLLNEDTVPRILCPGARHRVQAHKNQACNGNEKQNLVDQSLARFDPKGILQNPHIQDGQFPDTGIQTRKRVRFRDEDVEYQRKRDSVKLTSKYKSRKCSFLGKRKHPSDEQHCWSSQEVKEHLTNFDMKDKKKPIFGGLEFLLTGFPCKKEKEVERILRRYGGAVLADIPSPQKKGTRIRSDSLPLPIVICTKKLRTRKFLYGCAVSAFLLQVDWVLDSIQAGSVVQPEKYFVLPNQQHKGAKRIRKPTHLRTVDLMFCKVGIMLHGEHGFCLKLAEVIKHGQGCVYKSLHGMVQSLKNKNISVGIIIADNETNATRHLRKCASEQKIPVMSTSWIINCIYSGKLLPFEENNPTSRSAPMEIQAISASQEWTQEI